MKPGEKVKIKKDATLPEWIRPIIMKSPTGIIHKVYSDKCDVRTCHGLWMIDKKFLEIVK